MTNLFDTPIQPTTLAVGSVVYYADSHTHSNAYLHGLQIAKVLVSNDRFFVLDNGKRFNPTTGKEITRGSEGYLYPYTPVTKAMVEDAQSKLFLVHEVLSIDFSTLTTQQLSMILDVSKGAFTQITAPSPCGSGCQDTVEVAGINIDISPLNAEPDILATIGFNDATYELSDSELDDIEDADEVDDDDIVDEDEE